MVTASDLFLVGEPCLVVGTVADIIDPLTESLPDGGQIVRVRCAVGACERGDEMRVRADEPVPDVEDPLGLRDEGSCAARTGSGLTFHAAQNSG